MVFALTAVGGIVQAPSNCRHCALPQRTKQRTQVPPEGIGEALRAYLPLDTNCAFHARGGRRSPRAGVSHHAPPLMLHRHVLGGRHGTHSLSSCTAEPTAAAAVADDTPAVRPLRRERPAPLQSSLHRVAPPLPRSLPLLISFALLIAAATVQLPTLCAAVSSAADSPVPSAASPRPSQPPTTLPPLPSPSGLNAYLAAIRRAQLRPQPSPSTAAPLPHQPSEAPHLRVVRPASGAPAPFSMSLHVPAGTLPGGRHSEPAALAPASPTIKASPAPHVWRGPAPADGGGGTQPPASAAADAVAKRAVPRILAPAPSPDAPQAVGQRIRPAESPHVSPSASPSALPHVQANHIPAAPPRPSTTESPSAVAPAAVVSASPLAPPAPSEELSPADLDLLMARELYSRDAADPADILAPAGGAQAAQPPGVDSWLWAPAPPASVPPAALRRPGLRRLPGEAKPVGEPALPQLVPPGALQSPLSAGEPLADADKAQLAADDAAAKAASAAVAAADAAAFAAAADVAAATAAAAAAAATSLPVPLGEAGVTPPQRPSPLSPEAAARAAALREARQKEEGGRSQKGDDAPPKHVQGRCVCVFDFDETLRVNSADGKHRDMPAPDGRRVIEECRANGYAVSVASANPHRAKLVRVLNRVDPVAFNATFFWTPAFQYGDPNKTIELNAILMYFNTHPSCAVLFDDTHHNKMYADLAGVPFQLVNNRTGVRESDYQHALQLMRKRCRCIS